MKKEKVNARKVQDRKPEIRTPQQQKKEFDSKLLTPKLQWNCNYLLKSYLSA